MEFEENEVVKFQHAATLKGKEGLVSVTSLRLCFSPHSGTALDSMSFTWANVKAVEYSPSTDAHGRAVARISTVLDDKKHMIQLVHADRTTRMAALETMKSIISDIRKPGSSSTASVTKEESGTLITAGTPAAVTGTAPAPRPAVPKRPYDMSYAGKGHSNNILSTIGKVNHDGKTVFTLTPEAKALIFQRFPAVKKAFSAEVATSKMSEKAFWEAFLKSQYFHRPQDSDIISADRKLFTRHELPAAHLAATAGAPATAADPVSSRKRVRDIAELEVDLTASMDTRAPHSSSPAGMAALDEQAQLPNWVNADSSAILSADKGPLKEYLTSLHVLGGHRPCEELARADDRPDATYTVIRLLPTGRAAEEPTDGDSGGGGGGGGRHVEPNPMDVMDGITTRPFTPADCAACLPSSLRAKKLFDAEVVRVIRQAHVLRGHVEGGDMSLESLRHLDAPTRQEVREVFEQVTDTLRLFYHSTRNDEVTKAVAPGGRAEANIKKLNEISHKVEAKKQKWSHHHGQGPEELTKQQLVPIWSEMLKMIKRAQDNWDRMLTLAGPGAR